MGIVWRVRDLEFDRILAVKVMKTQESKSPGAVRRFSQVRGSPPSSPIRPSCQYTQLAALPMGGLTTR